MKVQRAPLVTALEKVLPGLAGREVIQQSRSFVFLEGRVYTYNDEISISHPVPEMKDVQGAVKAEELHAILSKITEDVVDVQMTEGELRCVTKRLMCGVALEAEISLPLREMGQPSEWHALQPDFLEGLRFCTFSAGTDMTMPVLTCIHAEGDQITSCDNFRITRYFLSDDSSALPDLLIPREAAEKMQEHQPVEYGVSEGWLHFRSKEGTVFSCRTYAEKYPDMEHLLKKEGLKIQMPSNATGMLERVRVFAEAEFKQDERVTVTIKDKTLIVHGRGPNGWCKERATVAYEGAPISFRVNPQLLLEILKLSAEAIVGKNTLLFETDKFIHAVGLLAVEEA